MTYYIVMLSIEEKTTRNAEAVWEKLSKPYYSRACKLPLTVFLLGDCFLYDVIRLMHCYGGI